MSLCLPHPANPQLHLEPLHLTFVVDVHLPLVPDLVPAPIHKRQVQIPNPKEGDTYPVHLHVVSTGRKVKKGMFEIDMLVEVRVFHLTDRPSSCRL